MFTTPAISKQRIMAALRDFTDILYEQGFRSSASLAGNCMQVHDQLQKFLSHLGIEAHMTVGSMHGDGWDYCTTSIDQLRNELRNPEANNEIRVHTWLTLNDASIIDWTGQAWYDVQVKEDHAAESCLIYFPQGEQDETHHYMPHLVGRDFLIKTRCIAYVPKS